MNSNGRARILLVRIRSLGDSLLVLPLVEALHAWRPGLEIDILVEAPFAPVFSSNPAVHETLVLKPKRPDTPGMVAGPGDLRAAQATIPRGREPARRHYWLLCYPLRAAPDSGSDRRGTEAPGRTTR